MTDTRTDRARLKDAFAELRNRGWVAHMNYYCCQTCGCAAIHDEAEAGLGRPMSPEEQASLRYAFWHNQDDEAFQITPNRAKKDQMLHSPLHIAWGGNGHELQAVLESQHLTVEWDGSDTRRVGVLPRADDGQA